MQWVLTQPLSRAELRARVDGYKQLSVIVAVELGWLLACDGVDDLNDHVETLVAGDVAFLYDIGYSVVGHEGNTLLLQVTGTVHILPDDDGDEDDGNGNRLDQAPGT